MKTVPSALGNTIIRNAILGFCLAAAGMAFSCSATDTGQGPEEGPSDEGDQSSNSGGRGQDIDPDLGTPDDTPDEPLEEGFCGDGTLNLGEFCDDGNLDAGDGCSGSCRLEPNYECPVVGEPCVSTIQCGDGILAGEEACDDGNNAAGDGCSADCIIEAGFHCPEAGMPCEESTSPAVCGNGKKEFGENCDDGQLPPYGGDGCDENCQLEPGYVCPVVGGTCELNNRCGDGKVLEDEACDDGNGVAGDGCTGRCTIEAFWTCTGSPSICTSTIVCGDGKVVGDESCDDGNTRGGDGCAADCKRIEPGYTCPNGGGSCSKAAADTCGDSKLSFGEFCDDGNTQSGDGCSRDCKVEPGYTCPGPGVRCQLIEFCGDGKLSFARGEECDDGGNPPKGGDGCSALCKLEANYICPEPGKPCNSTVVCGDGFVEGSEACDDRNTKSGDGCSADCGQVEPGFTCGLPGVRCVPKCGDGLTRGSEGCDDGNARAGDGCSPTCQLEPGYKCSGTNCSRTVCGDGDREGTEACDDGNLSPWDGCSPTCQFEPICAATGACSSRCGDGITLPGDNEECDDGNTIAGDGCSPTCRIEPGFECRPITSAPPPVLNLPVVYRDVVSLAIFGSGVERHPDFQNAALWTIGDVFPGLVKDTLGPDRKPVYTGICEHGSLTNVPLCWQRQTTGKAAFDQWYRDTPGVNFRIDDTLTLTRNPSTGTYSFDGGSHFTPATGRGWDSVGKENLHAGRNFGFTTEFRYWFQVKGGEVLEFSGDDDVWVFMGGKLALDMGGLHSKLTRTLTLTDSVLANLGLSKGKIYELAFFHAERFTDQSNFKLSMTGFVPTTTECNTVCGDGIVTPDEQCDDRTNAGGYGKCAPGCVLGPYCGDSARQAAHGEACDDGTNITAYLPSWRGAGVPPKCAPGCQAPGYCGNGRIEQGEQCDDGSNNGRGYGFCSNNCTLGPRCGDGATTHSEECDDGAAKNGTSSSRCESDCTLKCGNATLDPGEQCDNGEGANTGGYGQCTSSCLFGPRCGDGIPQPAHGEQCDDGANDGSYGTCAPGCKVAPHCGDGTIQSAALEQCDAGNQNKLAPYGQNMCTTSCELGPYCGDGEVDVSFGEACDDGKNNGAAGSCKADCSAWVPLVSCGDGVPQPGEECDEGPNNGKPGSACDARCRNTCGNGLKDPGEECDDGINDGSYGSCGPMCRRAAHCGDGVRSGSEQCVLGAGNQSSPYGSGKCTTLCRHAPYCGDGRIQPEQGEVCDGGAGCDLQCKWITIR